MLVLTVNAGNTNEVFSLHRRVTDAFAGKFEIVVITYGLEPTAMLSHEIETVGWSGGSTVLPEAEPALPAPAVFFATTVSV